MLIARDTPAHNGAPQNVSLVCTMIAAEVHLGLQYSHSTRLRRSTHTSTIHAAAAPCIVSLPLSHSNIVSTVM